MNDRLELIELLAAMTDEEFKAITVIDTTRYFTVVVNGEDKGLTVTEEYQKEELERLYKAAGDTVEFRALDYKETAFNSI